MWRQAHIRSRLSLDYKGRLSRAYSWVGRCSVGVLSWLWWSYPRPSRSCRSLQSLWLVAKMIKMRMACLHSIWRHFSSISMEVSKIMASGLSGNLGGHSRPRSIWVWLHHPPALILLAYYGVVLHRVVQQWLVTGLDARIIRAAWNCLYSHWRLHVLSPPINVCLLVNLPGDSDLQGRPKVWFQLRRWMRRGSTCPMKAVS